MAVYIAGLPEDGESNDDAIWTDLEKGDLGKLVRKPNLISGISGAVLGFALDVGARVFLRDPQPNALEPISPIKKNGDISRQDITD